MITAYVAWLVYHGQPIPLVAAWLWINELWVINCAVISYLPWRQEEA